MIMMMIIITVIIPHNLSAKCTKHKVCSHAQRRRRRRNKEKQIDIKLDQVLQYRRKRQLVLIVCLTRLPVSRQFSNVDGSLFHERTRGSPRETFLPSHVVLIRGTVNHQGHIYNYKQFTSELENCQTLSTISSSLI